MHLVAALPDAHKNHHAEMGEKSHIKLVALAKAQNAKAANSLHLRTSPKVEDDVEDMWDNLPI